MATFDDFAALDIRIGQIMNAQPLQGARMPAYRLEINFGAEIGFKQSSAQITALYQPSDLIDKQVLAVVNFPPKLVAGFKSEVLVLGVYTSEGVVLIQPDRDVALGSKLG